MLYDPSQDSSYGPRAVGQHAESQADCSARLTSTKLKLHAESQADCSVRLTSTKLKLHD